MKSDIWLNQDVYLWLLQGDDLPKFLGSTGMEDVHIGNAIGTTWKCSYCDSTVPSTELKCNACNAPRKTRKRNATAMLLGMLPEFVWFDAVKDGFTIEARGRRGHPCCYDGSELLARMMNCRILEKVIPSISPLWTDHEPAPLELRAKIEGEFSFADPEHEDE